MKTAIQKTILCKNCTFFNLFLPFYYDYASLDKMLFYRMHNFAHAFQDSGVHLDKVYITLTINDQDYTLDLELNAQLVPESLTIAKVLKDGQRVMTKPSSKVREIQFLRTLQSVLRTILGVIYLYKNESIAYLFKACFFTIIKPAWLKAKIRVDCDPLSR